MKKSEQKRYIREKMQSEFINELATENFIQDQFKRKNRNSIIRRIRMFRKMNLQKFNFFCTFTYDEKKHSEKSFRRKLQRILGEKTNKEDWLYIGVWERSPKKERLHFHGIFHIPNTDTLGYLIERNDYSFARHKRIQTYSYTNFETQLGRCDFKEILNENEKTEALMYIVKYIEKSGERIVYSKHLPQYLEIGLNYNDVVCNMGVGNRKLLLYDDFSFLKEY